MFHAINAFRYGFLGASDASIGVAFSFVCAFGILLVLIALALMMRGSGLRDLQLREDEFQS
jgi:ABC-2 type transport system permease protein